MNIEDAMLGSLNSSGRLLFLSSLLRELEMQGRGWYVAAGAAPARSLEVLQCINEMSIVVVTQLSSSIAGIKGFPDSYPDDVLFSVLYRRAKGGGLETELVTAIGLALERVIMFTTEQGLDPSATG